MKQIHKDYERPFLLEKTKLDRLLEVVHGRLAEHQGTIIRDDFEVFLSGQRREEMTSMDDLLKLDNSRKSKIQRLLVTCSATTGSPRPEHEIQVDFDGRDIPKQKTKVVVSVRSDDAGWSDRALSEVEEQVERTSLQDRFHRAALTVLGVVAAGIMVVMLISSFSSGSRTPPADFAGSMWLRNSDFDRVDQILKQGRTITEEEMREIHTRQLYNLLNEKLPKSTQNSWTKQKSFVGFPIFAIFVCALFLRAKCYPEAVFLWGDESARYANILQLRRIMWGVIVSLGFVGVLSKILTMGLFPGG